MGDKEWMNGEQKEIPDCESLETLRREYLSLAVNIYELHDGAKKANAWFELVNNPTFLVLATDLEFVRDFLSFINARRTMFRPAVWKQIFIPLFADWQKQFPKEQFGEKYPLFFKIPPDKRPRNLAILGLAAVVLVLGFHQVQANKISRLEVKLQEKYGLEVSAEPEKGSKNYKVWPKNNPKLVFEAGEIIYYDPDGEKQTQTDAYPAALAAYTADSLGLSVKDTGTRSLTLTYPDFQELDWFSEKLVEMAGILEKAMNQWPAAPESDIQVRFMILPESGYEKNLPAFELSLYTKEKSQSAAEYKADISLALKSYHVNMVYDWEPEGIESLPKEADSYKKKPDSVMANAEAAPLGDAKDYFTYGQVYQFAKEEGRLSETGSGYFVGEGENGKVRFSLVIKENGEPDMTFEYLDTHVKSDPVSGLTPSDLKETLGIEAGR